MRVASLLWNVRSMTVIRRLMSGVAIGIVIAIAAAGTMLWARSYSRMDGLRYCDASGSRSHSLYTRHGSIHYLFVGGPQDTGPGWKDLGGPQPAKFATISDQPKWRVL